MSVPELLEEARIKEEKLRNLLTSLNLDAIVLTRRRNVSWLTCGGEYYILHSTDESVIALVITKEEKLLFTTNNEIDRILDEEPISQLGYRTVVHKWYEKSPLDAALEYLKGVGSIGTDVPVSGCTCIESHLRELRLVLTTYEIGRLKELGATSARLLGNVLRDLRKGITEQELAGELLHEFARYGIRLPVILIAADDRAFRYRHPLPKDRKINEHVIVSIAAEKWGLHVTLTRLVHFGSLPTELRKRYEAVAKVDAMYLSMTRPGIKACDALRKGIEVFSSLGYPDEWERHTQGGWISYLPREIVIDLRTERCFGEYEAVSWNPTITGTKVEDTFIITNEGPVNVTYDSKWPMLTVEINGYKFERPDILVR